MNYDSHTTVITTNSETIRINVLPLWSIGHKNEFTVQISGVEFVIIIIELKGLPIGYRIQWKIRTLIDRLSIFFVSITNSRKYCIFNTKYLDKSNQCLYYWIYLWKMTSVLFYARKKKKKKKDWSFKIRYLQLNLIGLLDYYCRKIYPSIRELQTTASSQLRM